ncbi:MAG: hypothetical protein FWB93_05910 [Oscillospiraceae bacterium]|nr:hypothetical protein [Oscillospiraceae bacterium]
MNKFDKYYISDMNKGDYYKNIDDNYKKRFNVIMGALFASVIVFLFMNFTPAITIIVNVGLSIAFIALLAYRYPRNAILFTPLMSAFIYFAELRAIFYEYLLSSIQNQPITTLLYVIGYILITLLLYSVVIIAVPLPTLRNIKNGIMIAIIPVSIAFLMIFFSIGISIFLRNYLQDMMEFDEYAINEFAYLIGSSTEEIKYLATEILHVYMQRIIMPYVNMVFGIISFLFAIGGLIIKFRVDRNRKKANEIFRKLTLADELSDYFEIVKCAFYGGVEYENLILNNENTKSIVMEKEKDIKFCDFKIGHRVYERIKKEIVEIVGLKL